MLISWDEVCVQAPPIRGVIYIGAHQAEARGGYLATGLTNTIWCEANPEIAHRLAQSLSMSDERVFSYAICDEDHGVRDFHIASNDGASSSLLQPKEHLREYPSISFGEVIQVPTITLDTLLREQGIKIKDYNFISMDIQGAELLALRGMVNTLPHIDAIYMEVNFLEMYEGCGLVDEVDRFLANYGFIRLLTLNTGFGWGDALYVKPEMRQGRGVLMSAIVADIIMPVWNHLDITKRCVALIRENTIVPYRLIVSDGASTDGTGEWLRAQDDITAIIADTNEGAIVAINRGLEISTAPYVVIVNNDIEVGGKGWLKLLIEGLENNPAVGVISAKETSRVPPGASQGAVLVGSRPAGLGGCSVMRREVVRGVGLWDEAFTWAYNADTDYAYRIKLAGWQFALHYGVTVRHDPGAITIKSMGKYDEYVALGKQLLREKYPEVPSWDGGDPWR